VAPVTPKGVAVASGQGNLRCGARIAPRTHSSRQGSRHGGEDTTMKSRQQGITLIGFAIVLLVLGFFAFMAMKLVPSYIEYFGVKKAMSQMATSGNAQDLDGLRRELIFKMGFQYVDDATIQPKDITLDRANNGAVLHVEYDKQIPFIYNIDFLLHFENSVQLRNASM
jgi:hypothetical protein